METPHSFRRTVATVVRDAHGPAAAQQQLGHAKLSTTEAHYLQRQTTGPDVRETLDRFAAGESGDGKYQLTGGSQRASSAFPLKDGAPEGIRTPNLLIRSQMLYPLSYGRMAIQMLAEARGFEPPVPFEGDNSLAVSPIRPLWHAS